MWTKWLPWRYVISRVAKRHGFLDPLTVMARLHRFAQPSEVAEPIELLRAGVVFHARGLINSRAIQHNLDWVWPYWAERQFDPRDDAFVPRAFSITHVNLTHRNWTAVGQPDCDWLPIVDPRGLVTPLYDGWSIDAWVLPATGKPLLPSRRKDGEQWLRFDDQNLHIATHVEDSESQLESLVDVLWEDDQPCCRVQVRGEAPTAGWLVVAVRPTNPEGVSFIHHMKRDETRSGLTIDEHGVVLFSRAPDRILFSEYRRGDVYEQVRRIAERGDDVSDSSPSEITCDVGLATAAAMFRLDHLAESAGNRKWTDVTVRVPLVKVSREEPTTRMHEFAHHGRPTAWGDILDGACRLSTPDDLTNHLFDAAVRSLVLHSPADIYPGPYTYKRFWFRDAAFLLDGLIALGLNERAGRVIERFPLRQTVRGYFHSQDGEWDSNGEALWIIDRWQRCSGKPLSDALLKAVRKGVSWIRHKRLSDSLDAPHAGLMPAGFSAEHLGPNDFYYWDDFWSVAGLRAAARMLRANGDSRHADQADETAAKFMEAIARSLEPRAAERTHRGIPASPYRRMDAGAIGSVAVGYPLRLCPPRDPQLLDTVEFLLNHCTVDGAFFQDMIHSGVNAYLTLHLAQVLLRAGDSRYMGLMRRVAELASPTGQWPEAIHPRTLGGCMGDGQHTWAAAEWVLMVRSCFVREEDERLILASGIPAEWLEAGEPLRFGPTSTPHGPLSVTIEPGPDDVLVRWDGQWHGESPPIEIHLPGSAAVSAGGGDTSVAIPRGESRLEVGGRQTH